MKRIVTVLALLLALVIRVHAQWTELKSTQDQWFRTLKFTSPDTGFLSGYCFGNIYRTTDGGQTWDTIPTPFTESFYEDIAFAGSTAFAVGVTNTFVPYNVAVRSQDGGITWDSLFVHDSIVQGFRNIRFVNAQYGILVGPASYVTNDGGQSFSTLAVPPDTNAFFQDVMPVGPDQLIAAISCTVSTASGPDIVLYRIYTSNDGGLNWERRFQDTIPVQNFFFLDHQKGWAANGPNVLSTTDGGQTWISTAHNAAPGEFYSAPKFLFTSASKGYMILNEVVPGIVLWNGYLFETNDGGLSWELMYSLEAGQFESMQSPAEGVLLLATKDKLLRYVDGEIHIAEKIRPGFVVFPNPAQNHFSISGINPAAVKSISLQDIQGRTLRYFEPRNTMHDINGLKAGIYMLHIVTHTGNYVVKLSILPW
jgi:photosystem II stability/assembly factor-like uncharacterized protein